MELVDGKTLTELAGGEDKIDVDAALDLLIASAARQLLESGRDFYAQYHLPYFGSYATCELSALDRTRGALDAALARTEPFSDKLRNGLVVIEHARNQCAKNPATGLATLHDLARDWTTLDEESAVRKRIAPPTPPD